MTDTPARLKAVLAHRYAVEREIGSGGISTVHLATDLKHRRKVAIKVLRPELTAALGTDRFVREIEIAANLAHPHILPLFDSGQAGGYLFYVMPWVEGESLRERLVRDGRLPLEEAVRLTEQVASALTHAHGRGVIHRDIKPENILLMGEQAVVADFGIARAVEMAGGERLTGTGLAIGTPAYMSPEQAFGSHAVDGRADVYALGCVVHEMISGRAPFEGPTPQSLLMRHVVDTVPRLRETDPAVPLSVDQAVARALAKDPADRFPTPDDFAHALTAGSVAPVRPRSAWRRRIAVIVPLAVAAGLIGVNAGGVRDRFAGSSAEIAWARDTGLRELDRLINEARLDSAWWLGRRIESAIPRDPVFRSLQDRFASRVDVSVTPAGSVFRYRIYGPAETPWEVTASTPVRDLLVPNLPLHIEISAPGHETFERVARLSGPFELTLEPSGSRPPGYVPVPGGVVGPLVRSGILQDAPTVDVADYLLARFEVTNREFRRFVDAGGYRTPGLWRHPIIIEGRAQSWNEAMARFVDPTGRPGPSTWRAGTFAPGLEDHPVGGVSWYEAAAYAAFAEKSLPTVHHWYRAATRALSWALLPGSNFSAAGPKPVGTSGPITGWGAHDMAGNVREWALNATDDGRRYLLGGGWDDPTYVFNMAIAAPPWDRSPTNGIRLVQYAADENLEVASSPVPVTVQRDFRVEVPASDVVFEIYRRSYAADPLALNATVQAVDDTSPEWTREYVTFDAAYGGERMAAVVWLPRNASPPYQTVVLYPGNSALSVLSVPDDPPGSFLVRGGRALVLPILKGTYERGAGSFDGIPIETAAYREQVAWWVRDVRRTVDYLESRSDIDAGGLAYFGVSWGAMLGPVVLAVEPRFAAAILAIGGLSRRRILPEADPFHFAPRVRIPTLVLSARYDQIFAYDESQLPFFDLLGTDPSRKRMVVWDAGHSLADLGPPAQRESFNWLDRYLGPLAPASTGTEAGR